MPLIKKWEGVNCSAQGLADLFHIRRETVSRLSAMDGMPKVRNGVYNVADCVEWMLARERDKGKSETTEEKQVRIALQKEQTLRYKIENSSKMGGLLPDEIVQAAFNEFASTLASMLDGLGPRMAAELAAIEDPALILDMLTNECRSIRDSAATAFEAIADSISSDDDTEAAA